jgi:hypothetical protein
MVSVTASAPPVLPTALFAPSPSSERPCRSGALTDPSALTRLGYAEMSAPSHAIHPFGMLLELPTKGTITPALERGVKKEGQARKNRTVSAPTPQDSPAAWTLLRHPQRAQPARPTLKNTNISLPLLSGLGNRLGLGHRRNCGGSSRAALQRGRKRALRIALHFTRRTRWHRKRLANLARR